MEGKVEAVMVMDRVDSLVTSSRASLEISRAMNLPEIISFGFFGWVGDVA